MVAVRTAECGTTVYISGAGVGVDSLWRVGSVTKTFVMASILRMAKDGALGLDDLLADHVANVANSDGVTIRMLLKHQSGIFNYTEDPAFFADRNRVWQPREIVDLATAHAPYFAPGAGWHYSNTNYVLLGMILEAVDGTAAGDVLHARAIDLAGLDHVFLDGYEALDGDLATGYGAGGEDLTYLNDPSGPWTAGAMVASGADLADWIYTLHGTDVVLDADQRAETIASPVSGYGLATVILPAPTGRTGLGYGHTGVFDGYTTHAFYFPVIDVALAAVVNQDGEDSGVPFNAVARALYP